MISLIKLTENDKRLIIVVLLLFILLFVIAGYVGLLVRKIMNAQASKADDMLHDVVEAGVITNEKKLFLFGIRKNYREFFRRAWIPFLIMLVGSIVLILNCAFSKNWSYNIWDYEKQGFNTLFYVHDWSVFFTSSEEGFAITWPKLISTPHFSGEAWASYIFVPSMIVGGAWFTFKVQGYIARTIRIYKISRKAFRKTMENVTPPPSEIHPE